MSLFTCIKISKLVGRGGVIRVCICEKRMLCLYISLLLKFHGIEFSVFFLLTAKLAKILYSLEF
jgi:hypothetical protein